MAESHLDFEKPIAHLDRQIEELYMAGKHDGLDVEEEVKSLREKSELLMRDIYSKLTPWQITQVSRHPRRPYTLDYIQRIISDFQELHGDRMYADDKAIVGGIGKIHALPVMVIGHQKGRDTKERTRRNFGMPHPEGYRKAQRLMKLAERFQLPILTLIDTAGAFPGVGAEERGQSEAIAKSLELMATLKTPIVSVIIGEGGSGGALAIGVCDHLLMLENSIYSVISPEGCASILWKDQDKVSDAVSALGMTTKDLSQLGLVDCVIAEPLGGAHRNYDEVAISVRDHVVEAFKKLQAIDKQSLINNRYGRLMGFGRFTEIK